MLGNMMITAPVFIENKQEPEIVFIFGKGLILQIAKKGGGKLFQHYEGEWIVAVIHGSRVIHSSDKHFSAHKVSHHVSAMSYAGWLANYCSDISEKYNGDLADFHRNVSNYEILAP